MVVEARGRHLARPARCATRRDRAPRRRRAHDHDRAAPAGRRARARCRARAPAGARIPPWNRAAPRRRREACARSRRRAATSASMSRPGAARTWIVTSRATSDCQSPAAECTSITAPVVSEARNVMMATTATSARPPIVLSGTIGFSMPRQFLDRRFRPRQRRIVVGLHVAIVVNRRHAAALRAARAGARRTGPSARCRGWRSRPTCRTCSARRTAAAGVAPDSGSTLPVGSSASSSCGRAITARAIAARCFSPPDSTGGSAHIRSPSPTHCSNSITSSR